MPTRDVDKPGDASSRSPPRRRRILSAVLWGIVGGLSVVVLVQAWLLVGGTMPVSYGGVLVLAGGVAVTAGAVTFVTEHRIARKRSKRRT
jgi:predicted membrane channel-forming protein YqfA (hemolysin III family)